VSPPSFPPSVPCSGAPFPPQGPPGCVPLLQRYYEALRLPDDLHARLRFLRQRATTATRPSLPRESGAHLPRAWAFFRLPSGHFDVESSAPPRFLEDPLVCVPRSQTPARPQDLACFGPGLLPSATRTASALATIQIFRGSITRPTYSLSTLRSPGCPGTTQDSLPAGGLLCRAGFEPAGSLREVSAPTSLPPHPSFAWRTRVV